MNDTKLTEIILQELRVGGPKGLSEDERLEIAQTTLLKLYKHYPNAAWPERTALCRRIARLSALDHLRRQAAQKKAREGYLAQTTPSRADDPSTSLQKAEIRSLIMAALVESLTLDERRIIHERFFQDRTLAEIAAEMNLPISTLHIRLMRSLAKLSTILGKYENLME